MTKDEESYSLPRGQAAVLGAILITQGSILAALAHLHDLPEAARVQAAGASLEAIKLARKLMGDANG